MKFCRVNYKGFIYPELHSLIRDNVKVLLDLTSYVAKKELEHSTSIHTAAQNKFCCFESRSW